MLKSDHVQIKRLLRELADSSGWDVKKRETLVSAIERELKSHAQIEEEIFYPAFRAVTQKTDAEALFYEAAEEHHIIDMILPALKAANPKSKDFSAKAAVLKHIVEHHIKHEATEMFSAARDGFSEEELRELGSLIEARRELVEAIWENPLLRPVKKLQSATQKFMPARGKTARAAKAAAREHRRMTDE